MKRSLPVLAVLCGAVIGCGPTTQGASPTAEQRLGAIEARLIKLESEPRPSKHYQIHKDGFRTWRFEPATGEICILLTSDSDWKDKDTKDSSCSCKDLWKSADKLPSATRQRLAGCGNIVEWAKDDK